MTVLFDDLVINKSPSLGDKLKWASCPSTLAVSSLYSEELNTVFSATTHRQREFFQGRMLLRALAADLNVRLTAIGRDENKAPVLPPFLTASLSHNDTHVISVMCKNEFYALGIDVESSIKLSPKLQTTLFTPKEIKQCQNKNLDVDPFKILFSAKESAYKCFYNGFKQRLSFKDISLSFTGAGRLSVFSERKNVDQKNLERMNGYYWYSHSSIVTLFTCDH